MPSQYGSRGRGCKVKRQPTLTSNEVRTERQSWLDSAKGVGICLVVIGHVLNGLFAAGIVSQTGLVQYGYFAIYTFHMPLFFFLSGINVERSLSKGIKPFFEGKLFTIVFPYFLWCVLQGLTQLALSADLNHPFGVDGLLRIPWSPIGHLWFLYALMICHVIAAAAAVTRTSVVGWAAAAMAVHWFCPPLLFMTLFYFCFYAAGVTLGPQVSRWQPVWRHVALQILATIAVFIVATVVTGLLTDWNYLSLGVLPAAAIGIFGVVLASKNARGRFASISQALGAMSMTIFVLHVMAAAGTRVVLMKSGLVESPWIFFVAGVSGGILLPIAAHLILSHWKLLAYFALAPPESLRKRNRNVSAKGVGHYTVPSTAPATSHNLRN
jgi:fucose 4-O-acetylase-like acetyltransferase